MKSRRQKWFQQKIKELSVTGKLDLSGEVLENLSIIGTRHSMKILDLSFSSIRSFEELAYQPKLDHLILDGSTISSFKNGFSIRNITKVSLKNTPISKIPNYKISLLLICGKNLRIVDGKIIPESLKKKVETYPPIVANLIDCGWIAEYPCPSEEDLRDLCISYGIKFEQYQTSAYPEMALYQNKNIDDVIAEYSKKHKSMLNQTKEKLEDFKTYDMNENSISITSSNMSQDQTELLSLNNDTNNYSSSKCGGEESVLEYDTNCLTFCIYEIFKKYGFHVEERQDTVSSIASTLSQIIDIAEGQNIDLSNTLFDRYAILNDGKESEEEEEDKSLASNKNVNSYRINKEEEEEEEAVDILNIEEEEEEEAIEEGISEEDALEEEVLEEEALEEDVFEENEAFHPQTKGETNTNSERNEGENTITDIDLLSENEEEDDLIIAQEEEDQ